ncbi:peptidase inhibitor family I36 protein [Streptomyces sp. NPDC053427]|uniref:peptidase inhibitor family I36 protein n=1 Tax=Streptomyces sp. NPDC053427 TaxID=3365701 RepID=UPI0037D1C499
MAVAQDAQPTTRAQSAQATLNGKTIDLAKGWQGADVCEVTAGATTCWDRETAGTRAQKNEFALKYKCNKGWVCLYDEKKLKGRMLRFNDGGWNNLGKFGFNNKMSSLWNRQSGWGSRAWFSTKSSGRGTQWYYDPGKVTTMSKNYDDKANSVYP